MDVVVGREEMRDRAGLAPQAGRLPERVAAPDEARFALCPLVDAHHPPGQMIVDRGLLAWPEHHGEQAHIRLGVAPQKVVDAPTLNAAEWRGEPVRVAHRRRDVPFESVDAIKRLLVVRGNATHHVGKSFDGGAVVPGHAAPEIANAPSGVTRSCSVGRTTTVVVVRSTTAGPSSTIPGRRRSPSKTAADS